MKKEMMAHSDSKIMDKSESPLRWLVLFIACMMMIANYYCYDIPSALSTQIESYMGNPSDYTFKFNLLYTVYAIPNIFLPFFGGYFVDKFGVRVVLFSTSLFIASGQCIFALGLSIKSWPVMYLGRVVFGFGGESMGVANSAVLASWFKGKELAFAFGLNLSVARLGSVMNNLLSPVLAESSGGVVFATWFGAILCAGSVGCVSIFAPIDRGMDAVISRNKGEDEDSVQTLLLAADSGESTTKTAKPEEETKFSDVKKFPISFWILATSCVVVYGCVLPFNNIASPLLLERSYFKDIPSGCELSRRDGSCQGEGTPPNEPQDCPSSKWYQLPLPYNVTIDGTYYAQLTYDDVDCTDDVWSDGCTKEFCSRYDDGVAQAAVVMSIPYIISACMSPFLGAFVDRFGSRAVIATIAPATLVIVHSIMSTDVGSPIGPMVGQGLAYSGFAAVIWPSIPLVIPSQLIGFGYGVVTAIQNAGLAIFPLIIAAIYEDSDSKYIPNVEYFFVSLAVFGTVIGFYLNFYDYTHNSIFNSPNKFKEVLVGDSAQSNDRRASRTMSAEKNFTIHGEVHRALSTDPDSRPPALFGEKDYR